MTKHEKKTINALLREYVIKRDGEKCLRCNKTEALAMSHIYPKGTHRSMEYDVDNLKLLCFRCHMCWWHKSPIEAWDWLKEKLPQKRLDRLKLLANTTNKVPEYKLLKLWLEKELQKPTL